MELMDIFFNVHMRYGHDGLAKILAKKTKEKGHAIFINKKWTALKLLTPDNVLLHLRQPANRPIEPRALKYLPSCVGGGAINYDKALEKALNKEFENRGKR